VTSTGITQLRAVLRAIEVTIFVFTMKFQTGAAGESTRVLTRKRRKTGREKERERGEGVVQGMET